MARSDIRNDAMAVADVAKVIVDSAKVEVAFLKVTGALRSSDFLPTDVGDEPKRALRAVNER